MKQGFTMAEVLITLGIIGIVAAITLSSVINKFQEKQTVTKVKVFYSKISQAAKMAIEEDGSPEGWDLVSSNSFDGSLHIYEKLSKYLKIIKVCGAENGCMADGKYKDGSNWMAFGPSSSLHEYKFITADGFSVYIQTRDKDCKESYGTTEQLKEVGCAFIGVDVNGKTRPNALGKDLFIFILTRNGVIARGGAGFNDGNSFEANCLNSKVAWACAAWVVYNENMDYLYCNDLSWEGKSKCK